MQENGRQRAAKINRHYHAAFDRFVYRKRWLSVLGLLVGIAYSAWLFSSHGAPQLTTGALSQPHYAWNKTGCENCHLPNVPIRKDAFGGNLVENIAKSNQQCNDTCHSVSNHFSLRTKSDVLRSESCSTCHREHLGFERSLVAVPDKDCTRCHSNMSSIAIDPANGVHSQIHDFSKPNGHPEFASLQRDPGTIRFSHIQHMSPGQPTTDGGRDAKRLEMLPEKFRIQYRDRVNSDGLIQLSCSSCHARDVELKGYDGLESSGALPVAAARSSEHTHYRPIEFGKHCAACHDLDGIPHGLDRVSTKLAIEELVPRRQLEFFRNRFQGGDWESLAKSELKMQVDDREQRLQALTRDAGSVCSKCHQNAPLDSPFSVLPSNLKSAWFRNAAFSHGAHLMVSCKDCHDKAYGIAAGALDSTAESKHVIIAGIASCRACHIQDAEKRAVLFAKNRHVASADCVDCHRYHVDAPKGSTGATQVSVGEIHRFLNKEVSH